MKIEATTKDAYQLFHDGILALARAERQGIRIDLQYCKRKKKHLDRKITYIHGKLQQTQLFRTWKKVYKEKTNIDSNPQLAYILYTILKKTPSKFTDTGKGSTDEEALSQMKMPELDMILEIRKLRKIRDTYLGAFIREQHDGYIHPFFNLHTVRTFRSSSDKPNFQNIPKRDEEARKICRRALLPRPGHQLIEMDFSGIEVAIAACYHKDPEMLKYIKDPKSDMHLDMAKQIFMFAHLDKKDPIHYLLRQAAKNGFVFPQFYGDYYGNNAVGLCEWVKLPQGKWKKGMGIELPDGSHIADHFISKGISEFGKVIKDRATGKIVELTGFLNHMRKVEDNFWNTRFKKYSEWKKYWHQQYLQKGYLKMLTGFTCKGVMKKNEVINYPVQGAAFHCLLWSFIRLDEIMRKEKWDSKLIGQIHDSVIMDVHPDELQHIKETIIRVTTKELPAAWKWIIVPLEVEIDEYKVDQPWIAS